MTARIVLSVVLGTMLAFCACQYDDQPYRAPGIGTSPSDPLAQQTSPLGSLPVCGVWIGVDTADADAKALSGAAPDALFFAGAGVTCSDAIAFANLPAYRARSVVRAAVSSWHVVP